MLTASLGSHLMGENDEGNAMINENTDRETVPDQQASGTTPTEDELRKRTRALTNRAASQAELTFRDAVRPVYGVTQNGRPDQLGSSVLLEVDGIRYIVTAAHVIDANRETTLYVGGNDELIPLIAEFKATEAPAGNRDHDHYDFAVATLPEAMLAGMDRLKFITPEEIVPQDIRGDRTYLTALGYPNTKNKPPRPDEVKVRAHLFSYSDFNRPSAGLADELGVSGEDHLFIRHGKYSRDAAGNKASSVAPRGLSGGAIIHSGDFSDTEVLLGRVEAVPRLAGITIELHTSHHVLLGTQIHTILDAIHRRK